jgi:hypothetical protein
MTDRELLELAAKAAGIAIECDADKAVVFPSHYSGGFSILNERGGSSLWNPLTDDGDALRLMVKLNLSLHVTDGETLDDGEPPFTEAIAVEPSFADVKELHGSDKLAATRRAIVRCAAEIGRTS